MLFGSTQKHVFFTADDYWRRKLARHAIVGNPDRHIIPHSLISSEDLERSCTYFERFLRIYSSAQLDNFTEEQKTYLENAARLHNFCAIQKLFDALLRRLKADPGSGDFVSQIYDLLTEHYVYHKTLIHLLCSRLNLELAKRSFKEKNPDETGRQLVEAIDQMWLADHYYHRDPNTAASVHNATYGGTIDDVFAALFRQQVSDKRGSSWVKVRGYIKALAEGYFPDGSVNMAEQLISARHIVVETRIHSAESGLTQVPHEMATGIGISALNI